MKLSRNFRSFYLFLTLTLISCLNSAYAQVKLKVQKSKAEISTDVDYLHGLIDLSVEKLDHIKFEKLPKDLIILLDQSGSMNNENKMEHAKEGVKYILKQLRSHHRVCIISFDDKHRWLTPKDELLPATDENIEKLIQAVDEVKADGMTNFTTPLVEAIKVLKKRTDQHIPAANIILFTDGRPTAGPKSESHILAKLSETPLPPSTSIHSIGLGEDHNANILRAISGQPKSVGHYLYLKDQDQINAGLASFSATLLSTIISDVKIKIEAVKGTQIKQVYSLLPFKTISKRKSLTYFVQSMSSEESKHLPLELVVNQNDQIPESYNKDQGLLIKVTVEYRNLLTNSFEQKSKELKVTRSSSTAASKEELSGLSKDFIEQILRFQSAQHLEQARTLVVFQNEAEKAKQKLEELDKVLEIFKGFPLIEAIQYDIQDCLKYLKNSHHISHNALNDLNGSFSTYIGLYSNERGVPPKEYQDKKSYSENHVRSGTYSSGYITQSMLSSYQ